MFSFEADTCDSWHAHISAKRRRRQPRNTTIVRCRVWLNKLDRHSVTAQYERCVLCHTDKNTKLAALLCSEIDFQYSSINMDKNELFKKKSSSSILVYFGKINRKIWKHGSIWHFASRVRETGTSWDVNAKGHNNVGMFFFLKKGKLKIALLPYELAWTQFYTFVHWGVTQQNPESTMMKRN